MQIEQDEINALMCGDHTNPHRILGMHKEGNRYIIRAYLPEASKMEIVCKDCKSRSMARLEGTDIFEGHLTKKESYRA